VANQPEDSQREYQLLSTAFGSKLLSRAMLFLLWRLGLARGEGVLHGLAHGAAQLLFQLGAQACDLLVQLGIRRTTSTRSMSAASASSRAALAAPRPDRARPPR
jgi:hypothetical protein